MARERNPLPLSWRIKLAALRFGYAPVRLWNYVRARRRGWRVGHEGRDHMYYEEFVEGHWRRLTIGGEMLTGRPHHVVFLESSAEWSRCPEWAHGRRDEIVERIKSEFRNPDYVYHAEPAGGTHVA